MAVIPGGDSGGTYGPYVADLILILLKPTVLVFTRELLFEVVSAITLTLGSVAAVQSCRTKVKFTIFE